MQSSSKQSSPETKLQISVPDYAAALGTNIALPLRIREGVLFTSDFIHMGGTDQHLLQQHADYQGFAHALLGGMTQ